MDSAREKNLKMILHRFFLICLFISIISCGLSVSLSQGFLAFAFLFGLLDKKDSTYTVNYWKNSIFLTSLLFWVLVFINVLYHWSSSNWELSYLKRALSQEPKDVYLFLTAICMLWIRKEDFNLISKAFFVLTVVIVISGFISIFSEYRLAWLVSSLYKNMSTWGKQHLLGEILGVKLYLPIGFMNTHLTYGGIAMLLYPFVFFQFLQLIFHQEKNQGTQRTWKQWLFGLFFIMFSIVFLFNNARSAILGAFFSILIGIYLWKLRGLPFLSIKLLLVLFFSLVVVSFILWNQSDAFRIVVGPLLGYEKHTDSGRTFIWSSSLPLALENPITGVGPGNYANQIELSRKKLSLEYPELLFFYETTQRGHAHNDYIHLAAVFGFPILFVYLLLYFFLSKKIIESKIPFPNWAWFFGIIGFGFASLLQCYFQDDEVVIVFWYLVGYFLRLEEEFQHV